MRGIVVGEIDQKYLRVVFRIFKRRIYLNLENSSQGLVVMNLPIEHLDGLRF